MKSMNSDVAGTGAGEGDSAMPLVGPSTNREPDPSGAVLSKETEDEEHRLRKDASEALTELRATATITETERAETQEDKRILVAFNAAPDIELDEAVRRSGGKLLCLSNFGEANAEVAQLMHVKRLLREGRVIWLRAEVSLKHVPNAKWLSQCCRMAHRAGVSWSVKL